MKSRTGFLCLCSCRFSRKSYVVALNADIDFPVAFHPASDELAVHGMTRRSILGLVIIFAMVGAFLARRGISPGNSSRLPESVAEEGSADTYDPAEKPSRERKGETHRSLVSGQWRYAKELSPEGEKPPAVNAPVFLGYLQSDPARTKLRIDLRQETGAPINPAELAVQVDLLDDSGKQLPEDTRISISWQTKGDDFAASGAPVLRVDSSLPAARAVLTLSYKGEMIERRSFLLPAP